MSFGERIQRDFSTMTIVLIPVAIAINIIMGQIVGFLQIPGLFLDSIGTVLVGVVAGPWAGALTGIISNTIWGLFSPTALPWFPVAAAIGLVAGVAANYGLFRTFPKVILAGILVSIAAATMSIIISLILFGGLAPDPSSLITAFFIERGLPVELAVTIKSFLSEPIDKVATCILAWAIIKGLSTRYISRFPRATNVRA